MRFPKASRKPSNLSDRCLERLNGYALAAGAAGVGMLALAQPAAAEVVYTPADHVILRHSSLPLDLNRDGKVDFYLNQTSGCSGEGFCQNRLYAYIPFYRDRGNGVVGQNAFPFHAYALQAGAKIGGSQPFNTAAASLYFNSRFIGSKGRCSGSWVKPTNAYLGLRLIIHKEAHFGWARVSARCELGTRVVGMLEGYAYETVANQPILAGQTQDRPGYSGGQSGSAEAEGPDAFVPDALAPDLLVTDPLDYRARPATLGMLALGAQGLSLWRKELAGVAE